MTGNNKPGKANKRENDDVNETETRTENVRERKGRTMTRTTANKGQYGQDKKK